VVLAYSGGLDTSVSILWLREKYGYDVVTLTVDVGQKEDLKEVEERAKAIGALRHYSIDAKSEFASDYIFPSIKANALYEGKYPLGTALARPLIAKKLVEVAEEEGAEAVAHGCTGKGNDQVRFDVTIRALNPRLKIIAPVREWGMDRESERRFAVERGIPISQKKSRFSIDQNLWSRSIEGSELEDPFFEPPQEAFEWVKVEDLPDEATYVTLRFEGGVPIALDGEELAPVELIERLNSIAGANGFGIVDHVEDRLVGIKSREVYEAPAALSILEAHKDLEKLVLTKHELEFKRLVDEKWSWLVYNGLWIEPLRMELDSFINEGQKRVNGEVRLKYYKGGMRIVGRKSSESIYDRSLATYEGASAFDQSLAKGFIELWGLQSRLGFRRVEG